MIKKLVLALCAVIILVFACFSLLGNAEEQMQSSDSTNLSPPPIAISANPLNLWVPYDPKNFQDLSNLQDNFVFIGYDDLKAIQDAKNPVKIYSGTPPASYQISSVNFFTTVNGDYITTTGIYNIQKFDSNWTLIPFISEEVGLASSFLDGSPAFITSYNNGQDLSKFSNSSEVSSGNYYVAIKNKGNHQLKISFTVRKNKDSAISTESFSFGIPQIASITENLTIQNKGNLGFDVPDAVSAISKSNNNNSQLTAVFPPVNNITVRWNPKSSTGNIAIKNNTNTAPSIIASLYTGFELGRGTLRGTTNVDIDVRHSAISHFEFYVPEGIEIESVSSTGNVQVSDPYPEIKNNRMAVDLASAVEGKVRLTIKYWKTFNDTSFTTKLPVITLLNKNIDREAGWVAINETTDIEANVTNNDPAKPYQPIDSSELQGTLAGMKASIAFKYQKSKEMIDKIPYDLTLNVVRHQDVEVYKATIESIQIDTVMNPTGQMLSKATFQVKNTQKQFLQVQLPANSEIWSVYVGDKSAKPAEQDIEKLIYSIPLDKSDTTNTEGKSFPVEIVYFTKSTFFIPPWLAGFKNIDAISSELSSNEIKWRLFLPKGYSFWPLLFFSNVQPDPRPNMVDYSVNTAINEEKALDQAALGGNAPMPEALPAPCESGKMKADKEIMAQTAEAEYDGTDNIAKRQEVSSSEYKEPQSNMDWFASQATQKIMLQGREQGKLPVYIALPISLNDQTMYHYYQLAVPANVKPYIFTLYAYPIIFAFSVIAMFGVLIWLLIKPIKERKFISARFILPVLGILWLTSILEISWTGIIIIIFILGLLAITLIAIWLLIKHLLKCKPRIRKIVFTILGAAIILLILFILLAMFHLWEPCLLLIFLGVVLTIALGILFGLFKLIMHFIKRKKPVPPEKTNNDTEIVSTENMEVKDNE